MNYLGIALIAAVPVIYGTLSSRRAGDEIKQLDAIVKLINSIREYIAYQSLPVMSILRRVADDERFYILGFRYLSDDYDKLIEIFTSKNGELCICGADRQSLHDFLALLGSSDRESQIKHCDIYGEHFAARYAFIEPVTARKQKLYRSLGFLAGAAVAIILF